MLPKSPLLRWPLLFGLLLLGSVSFAVSYGNGASPYAGWVTPLLLLLFSRHVPALVGFGSIAIATAVAAFVAFEGMIPGDQTQMLTVSVSAGIATALAYLVDRLAAPRLPEAFATLVLPTASVSLLYLGSLGAPFGTWGNDAYPQGEFLVVARLASLVGLWGVAFLAPWLASVIVTRIQRSGHSGSVASIASFGVVAVFIIGHGLLSGFGWTRDAQTVRTAMMAFTVNGLPDHACGVADLTCKQKALDDAINEPLFAASIDAASQGAELIAWHETAGVAYKSFEDRLLARTRQFAMANEVYLVAAIGVLPDESAAGLTENKVFVVSPDGEMSAPYFKAHPVPGEAIVRGDGAPVVVDTPFGRIGLLICFDADFTAPARTAAVAGAQLLIVPSNDWKAITPLHGEMTRFRAIENGVTVLRPASNGLAVAYDETGREQARLNAFADHGGFRVFDLRVGAHPTVQRSIGDLFAWFSVAGLGLLTVGAIASAIFSRARAKASS